MNREEILNMPPGREMDALIAKHVMALTVLYTNDPGEKVNILDWIPEGSPYVYDYDEFHELVSKRIKPYSTDIAAAWQVVEKLEENDWWWNANNYVPESDLSVYEWRFMKNRQDFYAREFTAPLAICRAALFAMMKAFEKNERPT